MDDLCQIVGEIDFGSDLTYERLNEIEEELKELVEEHLHSLDASHLDFDLGGDSIVFHSAAPDCRSDTMMDVCEAMVPSMEDGMRGRIVCVRHGFEEISVYFFSNAGCEEIAVTEP